MKYTFLCAVFLTACGFSDPRTPILSEDSKLQILLKAQQTANWATWCKQFPSNERCNDGDSMAGALGFLCAVGFKPSCEGVSLSVKNGQLYRSPFHKPTDNTASRDQLLGFIAAQLSGENRWLDVKRFIKSHGLICKDATDTRCDLTPTVWALLGAMHAHLGYQRDASMLFNGLFWDKVLLMQATTVPTGYQLNLNVEASWIAWQTGIETERTYTSAVIAFARQPRNPWFCIVALGADERCAQMALSMWPDEPAEKTDWGIQRDTNDKSWHTPSGWGWLFMAALFGIDLNTLHYSGTVYTKD